jgi:S1-C subfamily serine protease
MKKTEPLKEKKMKKAVLKTIVSAIALLSLVAVCAVSFEAYLYEYKGASVVKLTKTYAARSGGTGFQVLAPSGKQYTLTNAHICEIADTLIAHDQDQNTYEVKVIEINKKHDLCIMEPIEELRPLKVASNISLHERVWLIGHPALRPLTLESGHFAGNVEIGLYTKCSKEKLEEQLNKITEDDIKTIDDLEKLLMLLSGFCVKKMTAQYINNIAYGGNSGSPVVNKFGNVVGVLFAGRRDQPTASYTVPFSEIVDFLQDK